MSWVTVFSYRLKFHGCTKNPGFTYEEAATNIKEAAQIWLEELYESGDGIPIENRADLRRAPLTIGVVL